MDIEQRLLQGNAEFCEIIGKNPAKATYFSYLSKGQKPFALVVCCSDSRVVPEEIFSVNPGEIFVIRTAGNVINEGELATIEYGIVHLHISYVLVLGHTLCGAVHASMHNETGKYLFPILDNIRSHVVGITDETEAARANAKAQAEYLQTKFDQFNGVITYGIYDICSNKVTIGK